MYTKFPYGTSAENDQLLLPDGMLSIDIERKAIRLHDGVTQGGFEALGQQAYFEPPGLNWAESGRFYFSFNSAHYADGKWVAVGNGGGVMTGPSWDDLEFIPMNNSAYCVAYGNGIWVTVGVKNKVTTSTDGREWTMRSMGVTDSTNFTLTSISFGNGVFLAVGTAGRAYSSPDGITWTRRVLPITSYLYTAKWNGTEWMVGSTNGGLYTSTDLVTWTQVSCPYTYDIYGAAYGNGVWVFCCENGYILTLADDVWTQNRPNGSSDIRDIAFGDGEFMTATVSKTICKSTDGLTWSTEVIDNPNTGTGVAFGDGQWVIGGGTQSYFRNADSVWAPTAASTNISPRGLSLYPGGAFITAGSGGLLHTTDYIGWKVLNIDDSSVWNDLIYVNGVYTAVGNRGMVATSNDGVNWTVLPSLSTGVHLSSIEYGGGKYAIARGHSALNVSVDGVNWTSQPVGTYNIYDIKYVDGVWIAVGVNHGVYSSTDLVNWTDSLTTHVSAALRKIKHLNGLWVAVGDSGFVLTSADGVTWETQRPSTSIDFTDVTYGDGHWIISGDLPNGVFVSPDAVNWTQRTIEGASLDTLSLEYVNNKFNLLSANRNMYITPP